MCWQRSTKTRYLSKVSDGSCCLLGKLIKIIKEVVDKIQEAEYRALNYGELSELLCLVGVSAFGTVWGVLGYIFIPFPSSTNQTAKVLVISTIVLVSAASACILIMILHMLTHIILRNLAKRIKNSWFCPREPFC